MSAYQKPNLIKDIATYQHMLPDKTAYQHQSVSTLKDTILNVMQNSLKSREDNASKMTKSQREFLDPNARNTTSKKFKKRIE